MLRRYLLLHWSIQYQMTKLWLYNWLALTSDHLLQWVPPTLYKCYTTIRRGTARASRRGENSVPPAFHLKIAPAFPTCPTRRSQISGIPGSNSWSKTRPLLNTKQLYYLNLMRLIPDDNRELEGSLIVIEQHRPPPCLHPAQIGG